MSLGKDRNPGAICFRIILFANLMAMMVYGAATPSEMYKVTANCVTIAVTGLSMVVQAYVTLAVYACCSTCLPSPHWLTMALDGVCAAGWIAAIAVLSYWDINVVYTPRAGDPKRWFQCANAASYNDVLTVEGEWGKWINLVWCEVEVDGQKRLIGNAAAQMQLHVLVGLAGVSLLFTALILLWMRRGLRSRDV
ncbi:hypothetical protein BJY01DRAFT_18603 [Aspergillus pseudoustus]|uniref:MARVEL domain-containing protein n=1 Tax=Aspergillus pseudoustus TaxID=1810923 RepID=A0ABR4KUM9_9EURO